MTFSQRNESASTMSLFDLTGKVAVITGSSRGIGKSIAEEMAAHGAKVVIASRSLRQFVPPAPHGNDVGAAGNPLKKEMLK